MLLTRWNRNPSSPIDALSREFDRLFDGFAHRSSDANARHVAPPLALFETDESYEVEVEIPGVPAEDLDVSVHGKLVSLKGERKLSERENAKLLRREWGAYRFERSFELPVDIDAKGLEARLQDGILHLTLPKAPGHKPQKVKVLPGKKAE